MKEVDINKETDGSVADAFYANARNATSKEHSMPLRTAIKLYPKAIAWSLLISSTIIMEGYDVALLGNFYNFDVFNRKYGELQADGTYQVPARWQAGLSNGVQCGEIIGLFINGIVAERFGYRKTLLVSLLCLTGFIAIFFTAPNIQVLLVAEILAGIPWGVFQTLCITYASEVCPVALRGFLTGYVNFCWGAGQCLSLGILKAFLNHDDEWAYRIPYGLQWVWPVPIMIGVAFAPESPWWLVRKGKIQHAKQSLLRLTNVKADPTFDADETIDMMRHTTELERELSAGASYWDCFKGTDLRRTEIVCMCWAIPTLIGNTFSNYSTYFLKQSGLSNEAAYSFAIGQYGINMAGVFIAWGMMACGIGRRTLFLGGLTLEVLTLTAMGFMRLVPNQEKAGLATGVLMVVWAVWYQSTIGTACYSMVSELSSRKLQIKTIVIGRNAYNVTAIVANVLTPYMVNPSAWNWKQFTGFFWVGSTLLCLIYAYFRIPEPSGRTFAEIDLLFERGVSARQFKHAKVDAFEVALQHQPADDKPESEHIECVN
ncbi:MFS transporter, SP family, general alpha glucoside:H+ symporter [Cryptococcus neoformans]|nr:MFS transporter, SP family, general alpha glucoside:H+ symporter [Cryptococcus neoformans var. grubii]